MYTLVFKETLSNKAMRPFIMKDKNCKDVFLINDRLRICITFRYVYFPLIFLF